VTVRLAVVMWRSVTYSAAITAQVADRQQDPLSIMGEVAQTNA